MCDQCRAGSVQCHCICIVRLRATTLNTLHVRPKSGLLVGGAQCIVTAMCAWASSAPRPTPPCWSEGDGGRCLALLQTLLQMPSVLPLLPPLRKAYLLPAMPGRLA